MSKTPNKLQKTRAEIAAERGIGIRTLQRHVATEMAALPLEFKRHAARGVLLADRVNRILPVLLDEGEAALLKRIRDAILPGAIEVLGIIAPQDLAAMDMEGGE